MSGASQSLKGFLVIHILRQMIQRIAALRALVPSLDALYQEAMDNCFLATELGLRNQ